ncbi:hypothetical protein Q5P01_010563 [Channa striata]|uniref:Uncharacterized protein n=1 Tax=Channa striata TaxID=64152 RepID=A0AA88MY77_CHASR|nr:hypothetical protein Q5P01_010563 [Channa striata]
MSERCSRVSVVGSGSSASMMRHWQGSGYGAWPKVFVSFHSENRDRARQTLALLRKLTRLFDLNELRDADISYVRGQEPAHMLFLYVIQLPALFLSSCADERILATIMSVASAPFLEANFCDPLCAATLLKPMFLPWYESLPRKADETNQDVDPETKLQYYRLFTDYETENDGISASGDSRNDLASTGDSVQLRARGYKIEENLGKALWFVAPQAGESLKNKGSRGAANALYVSGVDLAEQSEGKSLYFGKIFTGPEDKKPPPKYKTTFGDFAMVTMGVSSSTDMLSMLDVQVLLVPEFGHRGHGDQTGAERTVIQLRSGVDGEGQGFNTGKFHEVACVKATSDPRYNEKIHKDALTEKSKYRLCLAHGSFAMFVLTLCMTMRQTVMISLGLFCTELARSVYATSKLNYSSLCTCPVTMATVTKFRNKKDSDEINIFNATYRETLKLTSPPFSKAGSNVINYSDQDDI